LLGGFFAIKKPAPRLNGTEAEALQKKLASKNDISKLGSGGFLFVPAGLRIHEDLSNKKIEAPRALWFFLATERTNNSTRN